MSLEYLNLFLSWSFISWGSCIGLYLAAWACGMLISAVRHSIK